MDANLLEKVWVVLQHVAIVQYPIEEEKGSVGSSSLHVKHHPYGNGPWYASAAYEVMTDKLRLHRL